MKFPQNIILDVYEKKKITNTQHWSTSYINLILNYKKLENNLFLYKHINLIKINKKNSHLNFFLLNTKKLKTINYFYKDININKFNLQKTHHLTSLNFFKKFDINFFCVHVFFWPSFFKGEVICDNKWELHEDEDKLRKKRADTNN